MRGRGGPTHAEKGHEDHESGGQRRPPNHSPLKTTMTTMIKMLTTTMMEMMTTTALV
jgi:hypothetical protein